MATADRDISNELLKIFAAHLTTKLNQEDSQNVSFIFIDDEKDNNTQRNVVLHANRELLSLLSPVFKEMFQNEVKPPNHKHEIPITDVDSKSFEAFLRYFYAMNPQITATNIGPLSYLANKYSVEGLEQCCQFFMDECVSLYNIVLIIESLLKYNQHGLLEQCRKWLRVATEQSPTKVVQKIFESSAYTNISVNAAKVLISSLGDSAHVDYRVLWKWVLKWSGYSSDDADEAKEQQTGLVNFDRLGAIAAVFPFHTLSVDMFTTEAVIKKILTKEQIFEIVSKQTKARMAQWTGYGKENN